ncbi:MAG: pimeloyl-ACP methyl ester carboxylesterase [Neolewinella sp.]|jgi:pimeloyl-ACP methyl ester carboxylesterase|nr:alpha/beta hydrolase [Lewinella sp.]
MKKNLLLSLLCLVTLSLSAQEVVTVEDQGITPAVILNLALPINVRYNIQNYKVTYTTEDAFGQPDTATGLLCLPLQEALVLPVVLYNHGTIASAELAPSVPGVFERFVIQGFAGTGYIAMAPDYLGLGDSDGIHPYLHADTEASAGRDMIIAVKAWLETQNIPDNEQIFVTGYSQGGHASMALARSIEADGADDGLELTAAAHLSGVYDINPPSPAILGLSEVVPQLLSFFLNTVISYNYVYNLYGTPEELFNEPYLTQVQRYINREIDLFTMGDEVYALMQADGAVVGQVFASQFVSDVLDGDAALFSAYDDNDLLDYAPAVPTLLYYCNADMTVAPENSISAEVVLRANGADSLLIEDGGALNHGDCAIPAIVRALEFFQGFDNSFPVSLGEPVERPEVGLAPNPVRAGSSIQLSGLPAGEQTYIIYDFSGRNLASGSTANGGDVALPSTLKSGIFVLRVGLNDGSSVVRRFMVR